MGSYLSKLQETVDRGAWRDAVHEAERVGHDLVTEQQLVYREHPESSFA